MPNLQNFFPFLSETKDYKREYLIRDLLAGLTLVIIAVPQVMSYAMVAGLPPIYGLYALAIPPIIGALWMRTGILSIGPIAIVSFLTYISITPFAEPGTPEFISIAIVLALLVGLIQLFVGIFRFGAIMRFISNPVIIGFTNAAAIIIATTQVRHLLGIDVKRSDIIFEMFIEIGRNLIHTHIYTLGVGLLAFAFIIGGKKISENFPGAMIAAIVTTIMAYLLNLRELGVRTVGEMPAGIPSLALTFISLEIIPHLIGPALVIAVIGSTQLLAISKIVSAKAKQPLNMNQNLTGVGVANITSFLFQSYPVSTSFPRSLVNMQAGAKTRVSVIFASVVVIITLMFFTPLFYYLPNATLAAIVMAAVVGLIQHSQFIKLYKTNKQDGIVALITFLFCLAIKPSYAIFIGAGAALIIFLYESMAPRIITLTRNPKTETFENADIVRSPVCPQILYLRPDFAIYFANAEYIRENIIEKVMQKKNGLKYILLDMEAVNKIDTTGTDELKTLIEELKNLNIQLYIANVRTPVRDALRKAGIINLLEQKGCLESKAESITLLFNKIDHKYCRERCPHAVFWECETIK